MNTGEKELERAREAQSRVSSDSNLLPVEPLKSFSADIPDARPAPKPGPSLWVRRLWLVIYVMFCVELGTLLAVLPWTQLWSSNALLAHQPAVRTLLQDNFVRGLISGIGVVDIWLGVSEAVHYRERRQ